MVHTLHKLLRQAAKNEGVVEELEASTDAETRVEGYARESNLGWAAAALATQREAILAHWLDVATSQPFHHGHRGRAVADDIPRLLDALIDYLQEAAPTTVNAGAPMADVAIQAAAQGHALTRVEQGLRPHDVLLEFRLLRQEMGHALRAAIPDGAPSGDVLAAELLLDDALDGAMGLALDALTAQIEQLREEFLATTIHEVRQPITRIKGFVQLAERCLDRSPPDMVRVRESLRHIQRAADDMQAELSTLAEASQTALGGATLQVGPTDLASLIHEVVGHLNPDIVRRIRLEMPPGEGVTGQWDAGRLAHVLNNLLSNAVKYSPPDTPVTVALTGDADSVTLSVRDEGIGIPPEELPRLFQRYVRSQNAVAQHIEGLGLGLYLCRRIVEAHGGRIWATSRGPQQGTTIFVELPRLPARVMGG